jgi:hypothetical protein
MNKTLFKFYSDEYRRLIPVKSNDYSPTSALTFTCWFKGKNSNLHQHICGHKNLGFSFSLTPINSYSHITAKIGINTITYQEPIQNNVWYFLAIVWGNDDHKFKFYLFEDVAHRRGDIIDTGPTHYNQDIVKLIGEINVKNVTYGDDTDKQIWIYKNYVGVSSFQMTVANIGLWDEKLSQSELNDLVICNSVDPWATLLFDKVNNVNTIYGSKLPQSILQLIRLAKDDDPCIIIGNSSLSSESSSFSSESSDSSPFESSSSSSKSSLSSSSKSSLSSSSKSSLSSSSSSSSSSPFESSSSSSESSKSLSSLSSSSSSDTQRGLFAGGSNGLSILNTISYIMFSSTGNTTDFGDLTVARYYLEACSSHTRGIFCSGSNGVIFKNVIDYVTIATTGNATDFGDVSTIRDRLGSCSSSTRGLFGGGYDSNYLNVIDYITIATTGNTLDFGDLTYKRYKSAACSSSTRGVFISGYGLSSIHPINPAVSETIDYVTIASIGDATNFGDLVTLRIDISACSNAIRGVIGGGNEGSPIFASNVIEYITIASTGDTTDFGDLTVERERFAACSSALKGVFAGGQSNIDLVNVIDYVTIATTGNATDFGDLAAATYTLAACSNSHGGVI